MATIYGANSVSGYDVANSLRFDDGSTPYLTRTISSGADMTAFTFSFWLKRSTLGATQRIISSDHTDSKDMYIRFESDDTFGMYHRRTASENVISGFGTAAKFRDTSAWYHFVINMDSNESTEADRLKMYVNGTRVTTFAGTVHYPTSGEYANFFNSSEKTDIGYYRTGTSEFFDGYLAEVVAIQGTAYQASSFGEFDSDSPNIWKPKDVSGLTFGTTGFYLQFEQSGTSQNSSGMGADTSGNDNHFTVNNLTALDQSKDTCTNNFATLNNRVNSYSTNVTFTEGNLKATHPGVWGGVPATIGVQNGRWYWECKVTTGNAANAFTGIAAEDVDYLDATVYDETGLLLYFVDGRKTVDGSNSEGFFDSLATDDIVGVHLDLESGTKTCTFTKNGSTSGSAVNLTANHTGKFVLPVSIGNSSSATANWEFNFGSPSYSISSANADDNGHGSFEYPPNISSTSYYALCTKNLAEHG